MNSGNSIVNTEEFVRGFLNSYLEFARVRVREGPLHALSQRHARKFQLRRLSVHHFFFPCGTEREEKRARAFSAVFVT